MGHLLPGEQRQVQKQRLHRHRGHKTLRTGKVRIQRSRHIDRWLNPDRFNLLQHPVVYAVHAVAAGDRVHTLRQVNHVARPDGHLRGR